MPRKNPSIIGLAAALGAVLGLKGGSPEEMYFETKKFEEDPETADSYSKLMAELNKIDPTDVDSFVISVVARRPPGAEQEPCPGCGGFHGSGGIITGGVAGSTTDLMAQITYISDKSGLTAEAMRG